MTDNHSALANAAVDRTPAALMDRHFLSVNGDLQGPFSHSQLEQQAVRSNAWVWKAGTTEWVPWSTQGVKAGPVAAIAKTELPLPPHTVRLGSTPATQQPAPASSKPAVGLGVPAERPAAEKSAPVSPTAAATTAGGVFVGIGLVLFKLFVVGKFSWASLFGEAPADANKPQPVLHAPAAPSAAPSPVTAGGLTRADLPLSSAYVEVRWRTATGASGGCSGSASPAMLVNDVLILLTNRHLLDLDSLAATKASTGLQISQYQMSVKLPSGQVRPVLRFHPEDTTRDLMALDIDGRGLRQGVDYALLPVRQDASSLQAGDEVVAVGHPGVGEVTFENTQTFGHVSALRDDIDASNIATKYVQTDAAINHGNSGGPLLVKAGDRYWWAGINTFVVAREQGYQGLNFAIDAKQAVALKYLEFDPSPAGVAAYLTSVCQFPATAATP